MKYMVLVNNKYLTPIETDGSACAAEHILLDRMHGIRSALAFDKSGMQTEYFANLFQNCEIVPFDRLDAMCREKASGYREEIRECTERISALNSTIAELRLALEQLEV